MAEPLSESTIVIDLTSEDNKFYFDHVIDGRVLFPGTGYLFIVWKEFARQKSTSWDRMSIIFENIEFLRKTVIQDKSSVAFNLILNEETGHFQLFHGETLVVKGVIRQPKDGESFMPLQDQFKIRSSNTDEYVFGLTQDDIYEELWIRGYQYKDRFKSAVCMNLSNGLVKVDYDNWIILADAMLQCFSLLQKTPDMLLPTSFKAVHCDPTAMTASNVQKRRIISLDYADNHLLTNGLEIYGYGQTKARRRTQNTKPQTDEQ